MIAIRIKYGADMEHPLAVRGLDRKEGMDCKRAYSWFVSFVKVGSTL